MKKTVVWLLVLVLAFGALLSGCGQSKGNGEETKDSNGRFVISVAMPNADNETWGNDDYYRYITDKIGITIDFKALSGASASEKARITILSGDMADVTYCDFIMDEYLKYGKQGIVKALPEDWEEKYPNLGFSMAMTGMLDELKAAGDNKIYGLVRPMDRYHDFLAEFRQGYSEGKNISDMMSIQKYRHIDKYGFAYRKDWAEQLGIKVDKIMTYDAFMDMARKFKEADLGNVGADNTVAIAVDHTEAPNIFVTAFNSSYKFFHKDENGKYVCGFLEDSTTEGLKAYKEAYTSGLLAKDFYTQKAQNLNGLFCAQRSGIIFPRGEFTAIRKLNTEFGKANPGLKATDCIDVCWIVSPDGKVHGREESNFYGGYYFNPDMSDEKFAKVLELADYVSSEEGGPQIKLGVPDKDFKIENGEYIITREKTEDGNFVDVATLYPSYGFFAYFINPQYKVQIESDPYATTLQNDLLKAKKEYELSLLNRDVVRDCYSAEDYNKFRATYDVNNMFAELVVSDEDIETAWAKKKDEFRATAESIAANMNEALLK